MGWFWWRIVELMFRFQFGLTGDLVPSTRLEHDLFTGGQILSYEFRDMLRAGRVSKQKGAISSFTSTELRLADGTDMEADIVVFASGFKKSYSYLDKISKEQLNRDFDGLYLYRNIFPTKVKDLCFIGAEVSTFNNILTQGLQALWLGKVLCGQTQLPPAHAMAKDIDAAKVWKESWMPKKGDRAAILQLHKMKYHDQLCIDMGVNHLRKGWNFLAEAFAPYSADDYSALFVNDSQVRSGATPFLLKSAHSNIKMSVKPWRKE